VIDEAQDILKAEYLDFLDLSLRGGLASGKWRLFGDFEKQSIFRGSNMSLEDFLATRTGGAPVYTLRVNCRNTPRVAELVHLLGGLSPRYHRILRPDDGLEPQILYFKDGDTQQRLLAQVIADLQRQGFAIDDIVILSPRRDSACVASTISEKSLQGRMAPYDSAQRKGHFRYCSIQSFKGMEASAVIVTDIERVSQPEATALFYIAATRALHRLVLLVDESAKPHILESLLRS
jgi:superfamily I DNA/RNA helicase